MNQMKWKIMDVAFADNLLKPRRLIVGVNPQYRSCYTTISESGGGCGSHSDHSLRTQSEWLEWIQKFRDDLTGKQLRDAIEAVKSPFTEPQEWAEFRKRYAETGDPFIK